MTSKLLKHRGENRIAVYFENNSDLITRIKKLEGSRWSQTMRVWHLPDTEEYRKQFGIALLEERMPSEKLLLYPAKQRESEGRRRKVMR